MRDVLNSLTLKELLGLSHWFGRGGGGGGWGSKSRCIGYKSCDYIYIRESLNIILRDHPNELVRSLNWEKAPTTLVDTHPEISVAKSYGKYYFNEWSVRDRARLLIIFKLENRGDYYD